MKALRDMNNVERGYLLANLFPNELNGVMDAIESIHHTLVKDKDKITKGWDNGMIRIDFWYSLANDVYSRVVEQKKQLVKSRRFADQLFDGYNALFTIDCIVKYAEKERNGSKFHFMVKALFNFE